MADESPDALAPLLSSLAIPSPQTPISPPTSPSRPKRSPLRTASSSSLRNDAGSSTRRESLMDKIKDVSRDVTKSLDHAYEIQEIRHSSQLHTPSSELGTLLSKLESAISDLPSRLSAIQDELKALAPSEDLAVGVQDLHSRLDELLKQHSLLKEEMKEDGWLNRFRTTADQATAMMLPLEKSLTDCLRYVEKMTSSPVAVPLDSELDDLPSIHTFESMIRRHEAMKGTYIPSISKIMKMMDKSISDRTTKNGEALRRFSDMSAGWQTLQRQLQQLDARIRIVLAHQSSSAAISPGEIEVLIEHSPSHASSPTDYFGSFRGKPPGSHRSSISSTTSRSSAPSKPSPAQSRVSLPPTTLSPTSAGQNLHRKSSFVSSTSSSTAKTVERSPASAMQTPTNRRITSMNGRYGSVSPTPSQASAVSSVASQGSRIPVLSPKGTPGRPPVPSLSVSTSTTHHLLDGQEMFKTPEPRRQRPSGAYTSMTVPRVSLTPTARPFTNGTAPRLSLPRNPPSSFRSNTPTPGRPSSRLSMASYTPSGVAPANIQPFQPSKYDVLDTTVQSLIDEAGFKLFVARVDAPMKRGQRRRDDEEWKGEYVFGAGQRTSSVKLLKLAGRRGTEEGPRMKCLVRVAGAWQDLATVLRKRQDEA